ncbi:RNA polymerase sigma factor [Microgenomates group bacterium]|nr:RNA polymerase sigma factor [Microgenomates group bacterium]
MHDKSSNPNDFITDVLDKHSNMVLRIAYSKTGNKADAEDIFQEVFVRLMRSKTKFDSEEHLKAWLIRVTVNCSKNLLASAWFRKTVGLEEGMTSVPAAQVSEIYDSVLSLPAKYRSAVHLHYYEGMSVAEMAAALGRKEGTIKSWLHRGRELLKLKLKGDYETI